MIIERAAIEDLEAICLIDRLVIGHGGREAYLRESVECEGCAIARSDGEAVGFAVWDRSFFGYGFIALVMTHPMFRRQGAAKRLIAFIENNSPTEKLFTSTNESNVAMQKVCESLGYVRSGTIENLDDGDPELIYFKRVTARAAE